MVVDSEGAAIRGAYVLVHWDASGAETGLKDNVGIKHDLAIETDGEGRFSAQLPPGFYDIFVSASAFSPDCRKIRVKQGETAIFETRLKVDPLVSKEIADDF